MKYQVQVIYNKQVSSDLFDRMSRLLNTKFINVFASKTFGLFHFDSFMYHGLEENVNEILKAFLASKVTTDCW